MNTQTKALRLDRVLQAIAPKQIAEAMSTQPEAMRLANYLELAFNHTEGLKQATAELRRLAVYEHESKADIAMFQGALSERETELLRLYEVNRELMYVVGRIAEIQKVPQALKDMARAAITKVEGEQK